MPGCSVKRCGNNSSKRTLDENGHHVTFHQFPSNRERRRVWVNCLRENGKVNKDGTLWEPNHNAKICSVHFEERYIDRNDACGRPLTNLTSDAVPSKFPIIKEKKSSPRGRPSGPNHNDMERVSAELDTIISVLEEQELHEQGTGTNQETEYLLPEQVTVGSNVQFYIEQQAEYILPGPANENTTEVQDILVQAIEGAEIKFVENAEDILHANSDLLNLDTLQQEESQQYIEAPQTSQHSFRMATLQQNETPQTSEGSKKIATLPSEDGSNKIIYVQRPGQQVATKIVPDESYQAGSFSSPQDASSSRTTRTQPFKPGDEKATGSSNDEDDDAAGACCQKFLEKPKDEKMDLSRDFRETLERLQHIQSELLKQVPAQQLARFGNLVQQLSAEGKSVLQSLAFITLQVSEMKRVRIPTSQEESLEDGVAESQRRRVDEVGDLLQADLSSVLDSIDSATMNTMMVSTDFDVLLALNADYSVASLDETSLILCRLMIMMWKLQDKSKDPDCQM